MANSYKQYIGDGVYADFDGDQIVLTTENGYRTKNTICLDGSTWDALKGYVARLADKKAAQAMEEGE